MDAKRPKKEAKDIGFLNMIPAAFARAENINEPEATVIAT